jgi:MFS family permease
VAEQAKVGLPMLGFCALLLAAAQAPLGSTLISIALPAMAHSLRIDLALATHWLVTSYLIVSIVGQSPGGRLGDALGHLRTVRLGMGLQALGGCLGLVANHLATLVVARCCIALGGALVLPASVALLRERSPVERRGRLFGWLSATLSLAAALGPPLAGELVGRFGWRAIFAASLSLWAASALSFWWTRWPSDTTDATGAWRSLGALAREFDALGTLLLTAALGALLFGSRARAVPALCGFVAIAIVFVFWERGRAQPVFDPLLFEARGFGAGTTAIALQNFAMYGLLFQLPNFFERVRGASPQAVGQVLFGMLLAMFAASPVGGRLCDRFGSRTSALWALIPLIAGSCWLQRLESFAVPLDAMPALLLLGVGMGLLNAPCQTAVMSSVASRRAGMAAGASATMRYLGGVLGIFMLRVVLDVPPGASALRAHVAVMRGFLLSGMLLALVCWALPGRATSYRPGT